MINTSRLLFAILILIASAFKLSAQRPDFGQLKKDVLEAQSKKEKAKAMMVLGASLSPRESQKTFSYADSILQLSEADNKDFYENSSTYLRAVGFYKKGDLDAAKKLFLSTAKYFENTQDETYAKCLNFIGIILLRSNKADSAVGVFNQILSNADPKNPMSKLSAYGNLGRAYRQLGNYAEAIDCFEQCVNLDSTNQFSLLNSYLNIAGMYRDMEFFETGINTLKQVDIQSIPPQPVLIAYFSNLGELYLRNDEFDSALLYLNKGLELAKKLRQPQQALGNRLTQVNIYLLKEDTKTAGRLLGEVKNDLLFYSSPPTLIDYHLKKANYFLKTEQLDSAIITSKKTISIAESVKMPNAIGNSLEIIAQSYEKKRVLDSSNYYYKRHSEARELQIDTGKEKLAQEAKSRYMLAQKEKQLSDGITESEKLKLWQKILLSVLIILVIAALYILFKFIRSKRMITKQAFHNEKLSEEIERNKNEIIELKSKAILNLDDIISIKADGHYLEFNLQNKKKPEVDRNQIKSLIVNLPTNFVQTHRSYVVNVSHIKLKQALKIILKDGSEVPISRTYKKRLNEVMDLV